MRIPEEFKHLVTCFYQGSDEKVSSLQEWAALALRLSGQENSPAVKRFLDELLQHSSPKLQQTWHDCGPDYDFADDELRALLRLLRDAIRAERV